MIASPDQHAQQTTSFGASSPKVSAIYGEEATVCVVPSRGRQSSPTMACLACCPMDLGGARLQRSREACIGQPMVALGYGRMQGLSRCQRLDLLRPQAVSWGILGERDRGLCRSQARASITLLLCGRSKSFPPWLPAPRTRPHQTCLRTSSKSALFTWCVKVLRVDWWRSLRMTYASPQGQARGPHPSTPAQSHTSLCSSSGRVCRSCPR